MQASSYLQPTDEHGILKFCSLDSVHTFLGIHNSFTNCIAHAPRAKNAPTCSRPINQEKECMRPKLLKHFLEAKIPSKKAESLLQEISSQVLCGVSEWHQSQKTDVYQRWCNKLWDAYLQVNGLQANLCTVSPGRLSLWLLRLKDAENEQAARLALERGEDSGDASDQDFQVVPDEDEDPDAPKPDTTASTLEFDDGHDSGLVPNHVPRPFPSTSQPPVYRGPSVPSSSRVPYSTEHSQTSRHTSLPPLSPIQTGIDQIQEYQDPNLPSSLRDQFGTGQRQVDWHALLSPGAQGHSRAGPPQMPQGSRFSSPSQRHPRARKPQSHRSYPQRWRVNQGVLDLNAPARRQSEDSHSIPSSGPSSPSTQAAAYNAVQAHQETTIPNIDQHTSESTTELTIEPAPGLAPPNSPLQAVSDISNGLDVSVPQEQGAEEIPLQQTETAPDVQADVSEFRKYKQISPTENLVTMLKSICIKRSDNTPMPGYIYAFSRPGLPGFLKIGYALDADKRLGFWKGCNANLTEQLRVYMPCAVHRMESLIHGTLREHRRIETHCNRCFHQHQEWFEVDIATVKKTVGTWEKFSEQKPYDDFGSLDDFWARKVKEDRQLVATDRGCSNIDRWLERMPRYIEERNRGNFWSAFAYKSRMAWVGLFFFGRGRLRETSRLWVLTVGAILLIGWKGRRSILWN